MKTMVGYMMMLATIVGYFLMMLLFGGGSPRIDASIDTKAQIGIAISVVGFIGAGLFFYSMWKNGRNS